MMNSKSTEMMKKTCKDHFFKAGQWFWFVFVYGIALIAFSSLIQKSFFAMILLPIVVYGIYHFFMRERIAFKEINYQIVFYVISIVFAVFMFFVAYSVRVQIFSWDWGKVIRSASEYTLTDKLTDTTYFARYPNNQFWYCILTFFFRMVHFIWPETGLNEFYLASIALGCVMTVASILLLHHIAVLIWNEKKAFFVGLMTWFCMPLWLWAMYAYTDIAGMLLLVVMLYCYTKAVLSEPGWKVFCWLCLFGVAASAAFSVKVTVFILFIAVFACLLLQKKSWKKIIAGIVIVAISFGVGHGLCNYVKSSVIPLEESYCDAYEFPLTHWIMMALGYGGYQQEDVDFTISFNSYEKKKEELPYKSGIMIDLSGGGLKVKTKEKLKGNDIIVMRIKMTGIEVKLKGQIVRIEASMDNNFLYGVKFLDITEMESDRIIRELFEIMRKQRANI